MERLGLRSLSVCLPTAILILVFGRMTGWDRKGHSLTLRATSTTSRLPAHCMPSGARGEAPVEPLNLIGSLGGGGLLLAFGMLCAIRQATVNGAGQVVNAAMVDGAAFVDDHGPQHASHGLRSR